MTQSGDRRLQIAGEINRLCLKMQQRNRAVEATSLVEAHCLVEISSDASHSTTGLAQLFGIDQSIVSRTLQRLEKRKLLFTKPDERDGRRRKYFLTVAGRKLLAEIDLDANESLERATRLFKRDEIARLARYAHRLADGLGDPKSYPRKVDHPLRVPQRRVTRCLGMLGGSFMGSDLSSSHWHVLSAVCEGEDPPKVKHIAADLGLAQNTVSQITTLLQRKGLLEKRQSKSDLRNQLLHPTAAGRRVISATDRSAAGRVSSALTKLKLREMEEFRDLLKALTSYSMVGLQDGLVLRKLSAHENGSMRGALIANLAANKWQDYAPSRLCDESHLCLVGEKGKKVMAVVQFERDHDRYRLRCSGFDAGLKRRKKECQELLESAIRLVFIHTSVDAVDIEFPPIERILGVQGYSRDAVMGQII